jgi:hypothetical protein
MGVTLMAQLSDGANAIGWTTVAFLALLAMGLIYFIGQCNEARAQAK